MATGYQSGEVEARGFYRGHPISFVNDAWIFLSDGVPVQLDEARPCGCCSLPRTEDGHDGCLGELPGVENACCGHGRTQEAYVTINGKRHSGDDAIEIFRSNGREPGIPSIEGEESGIQGAEPLHGQLAERRVI